MFEMKKTRIMTSPSWLNRKFISPNQTPNFDLSDYGSVNCVNCAKSRMLVLLTDYTKYKHTESWPLCNACLHAQDMRRATEPKSASHPSGFTQYINRVLKEHDNFGSDIKSSECCQEKEDRSNRNSLYYMNRLELLDELSRRIEEIEKQSKISVKSNESVIQTWLSQAKQPTFGQLAIEKDPMQTANIISRLFTGRELKRTAINEKGDDLSAIRYYLKRADYS